MRRHLTLLVLVLAFGLVGGGNNAASQTILQRSTSTPEPQFDPLKANKDVEVGTFYFKKGQYDAAIDRFQEATRLQPGLGLPYLKLGETYEKMRNLPKAIESYKSYLDVYKKAPDAKDVQKKIEELSKKIAQESQNSTKDKP